MTHPLAPLGCIICASHDVVASITVERNGVLAHYPTCAAHVDMAVRRVATDVPETGIGDDVLVHHHVEALDVDSRARPDSP